MCSAQLFFAPSGSRFAPLRLCANHYLAQVIFHAEALSQTEGAKKNLGDV
jgi:hypothetical protein